MRPAGHPDCFVIINGPEDGTEFPITRAPFFVGQDPSCAVNIRLDTGVRPHHARVTVVSDGYRVRSAEGAPVFVDGKRAGTIRSRIARSGGNIQVGHTLLALECAPDGLAGRSQGIVTESDFAWALHQGTRRLFDFASRLFGFVFRLLGHLLAHWKLATLVTLVALYLFFPPFRNTAHHAIRFCRHYIRSILSMMQRGAPDTPGPPLE